MDPVGVEPLPQMLVDVAAHSPTRGGGRRTTIARENETPAQRQKREKAAERQRRKRERDRIASHAAGLAFAASHHNANAHPHHVSLSSAAPGIPMPALHQQHQQQHQHEVPPPGPDGPEMSSTEELARKERVRAAARERQRKHRALVKARRMRELGVDMGNDQGGMPQTIIPPDAFHHLQGQEPTYQQVLVAPPTIAPPPPMPPRDGVDEIGIPTPAQGMGGQTFASTLLLSFSCAPLLKQHLLRSLSMTNEELASLEPVIAGAWDQWDAERRYRFAAKAAEVNGGPAYDTDPYADPHNPQAAEFRARFHRPLTAPSPFQRQVGAPGTPGSASDAAPSDAIDPDLTTNGTGLDSARGEAEGIAGRLET